MISRYKPTPHNRKLGDRACAAHDGSVRGRVSVSVGLGRFTKGRYYLKHDAETLALGDSGERARVVTTRSYS